jgi:H+/Na+-translocating ferredoxin:NAD+ oxidoreductase subunit B
MSDEIYVKLREFLDTLPGGFPESNSGVEMRILEKLFSPEDAKLVLCLSMEPESPAVIADRRGMPEPEIADQLESMALRGLAFRVNREGEKLYQVEQFFPGMYEHHVESMDREFAEMMEEYMLYMGLAQGGNETEQQRVVPVASTIEVTSEVAPCDQVRELIKGKETIAVAPCICRTQQATLGNECDRPWDACMYFSEWAEYSIENGWGRRIEQEEAFRLAALAEERGLVAMPDNAQDVQFICFCCTCCCGWLRNMKVLPKPGELLRSNYLAVKDADRCTACLTCVERCPMEAAVETDDAVEIDPERCIGCGLCLSTCPEGAITLVTKEHTVVPPATYDEKLNRILEERGLA